GPVTEVASFVKIPAMRYTMTVFPSGLPPSQQFTVALGSHNVTSNGSGVQIQNLLPGWYPLSVPTVLSNSTEGARYQLSTASLVGGTLFPNGTLQVNGDVRLNLTFRAEYLVTLSEVGSGTLSIPTG